MFKQTMFFASEYIRANLKSDPLQKVILQMVPETALSAWWNLYLQNALYGW